MSLALKNGNKNKQNRNRCSGSGGRKGRKKSERLSILLFLSLKLTGLFSTMLNTTATGYAGCYWVVMFCCGYMLVVVVGCWLLCCRSETETEMK